MRNVTPASSLRADYVIRAVCWVLAASLTGCAAAPPAGTAALTGTDACFWLPSLKDWTAVDDSTLLVHAPSHNEPFVVKLIAPQPGLTTSPRLAFQGGDNDPAQICGRNSFLLVSGPAPQREPIVTVRAVTVRDAARLLSTTKASATHLQARSTGSPPA